MVRGHGDVRVATWTRQTKGRVATNRGEEITWTRKTKGERKNDLDETNQEREKIAAQEDI